MDFTSLHKYTHTVIHKTNTRTQSYTKCVINNVSCLERRWYMEVDLETRRLKAVSALKINLQLKSRIPKTVENTKENVERIM